MRHAATALLLVMSLLLAGCNVLAPDPYRAHIDPAVLARSPQDWQAEEFPTKSEGRLGPHLTETRYRFDPPSSSEPPFPGLIQLFSLQEQEARSTTALRGLLEEQVEAAIAREGIAVRNSGSTSGEREVASGLGTQFFVRVGTVQDDGGFFPDDVEVRILGEVWHDRASDTSVIVVAIAQTAVERFLTGSQSDLQTWRQVAGDPEGSVDGQVHQNGFIFNVVSHD